MRIILLTYSSNHSSLKIPKETLGNSHTQNGSSEDIKGDIPFEFKDPNNPTIVEMEVYITLIDQSKFPGYLDRLPHELWKYFSDQKEDYVEELVAKFLLLFAEKVELEEDVYMLLFALHLEGKARVWFRGLLKAEISFVPELIELLCRHWCPGKQCRWIPPIEHARNLFNKEIQNEYQVEEANDISSTIDEVPHIDEYDHGPICEYQEVLVEEVEK